MIAKKFLIQLKKDSPSEGRATLEYISDGERIEIECSAAESNVENLIFLKDQEEIKSALRIEGKNKILKIGKFDGTKHAGIYHCATPTSNGALESTLMLKRYNPIVGTPYLKECDENMCRNGGKCFVPFTGDKTSFCLCPSDYAGQYCESHAISSSTVRNTQAGILIWSLVSTVFLLFILVGALVFFIYRYEKERSKRKRYQSIYGTLIGSENDGDHGKEMSTEVNLITSSIQPSQYLPKSLHKGTIGRHFHRDLIAAQQKNEKISLDCRTGTWSK